MQNGVIAKIDALVKMSNSSSNIGTLKVELRELECAIKEKKLELKELMSSISDDKYFDASGEIVDKNIEISLTKQIKVLKKSLDELEVQLENVVLEEEKVFEELEVLRNVINDYENFIDVLNTKILSVNNDGKNNFKTLLKDTESKLKDSKKELEKKQKSYEKIQNKLEVLTFSKNKLTSKIDSETEKLIDVKANLLNKRGYVNAELKQEDQDKIDELNNEIAKLEEEKTVILNDPVMIAEEAKNYLIDDDKTGALKQIKVLRDMLLELPYMDIDAHNSKETLAIELENAEAKRDEFASMINSKNYESVDTTLINDRITFITDRKEKLQKEIEQIRNRIKQLDENELEDLNNRINYCENEVANLKEKIEEYSETLDDNTLAINKKATLQASFDKKQEELNNIMELLFSYKSDRKNVILLSYELQTKEITKLEEEIKVLENEIKRLEKLSASSNKVKDIIAMENDKKILKQLNDAVKAIKKRQDLKNTPNEIYDEIEMLLGTEDSFEIEQPTEEVILEIPEVEEVEEVEEFVPITNEENDLPESQIDLEEIDIDTLPTIEDETLELEVTPINEEEKLKVINVESLDNNEESSEKVIDNEFLIGDYNSEA